LIVLCQAFDGSLSIVTRTPSDDVSNPRMISVTEQSLGNLVYRLRAT
jgi:hypothetical protein